MLVSWKEPEELQQDEQKPTAFSHTLPRG
jgi:hypothetical protein